MPSNVVRMSLFAILLIAAGATLALVDASDPRQQVDATERAFAQAMADRDLEAFRAFLSDEAVFLEGQEALRGKLAVAERWARLFDEPEAPFSWKPETVEVLDSGRLALSTGPVYDAAGNRFGTYTSIWRQEEPGVWRIVFDKGAKYCE